MRTMYTSPNKSQWNCIANHSEDQFIVMFGGLYIEMTALKTLGNLLNGSRWTSALAGSFLCIFHVKCTCTQRVHQITANSLNLLLQKAHLEYCSSLQEVIVGRFVLKQVLSVSVSTVQVLIIYSADRSSSDDLCEGCETGQRPAVRKNVPRFFALDHTIQSGSLYVYRTWLHGKRPIPPVA